MGTDSDREKNTQLLGLINILGDDYTNIYLVNRKTQQIEIYRYRNQDVDVEKELYKMKNIMNQPCPLHREQSSA